MAVRAEQNAVASLRACFLDRSGHALATERESFRRRVNMVELQGGHAAVIAACGASAARFLDEDCLDAPTAVGDGFGPAGDAPPRPGVAALDEFDLTV